MPRLPLALRLLLPLLAATAHGQESWDAVYMGGSKVGRQHVRLEPVKDAKGRALTRVRVDMDLEMRRGKDTVTMKLMYGTIEDADGRVIRLDTLTYSSDQKLQTSGEVADGQMTLTTKSGGNSATAVIPWGDDVRGPYGAEMSMARRPMAVGESRVVKTYIPGLNQVCPTTLSAKATETIELGRGTMRELLRVEQVVAGADAKPIKGMASTLWVDKGGQILKSKTDMATGMLTYRTTEAGAKAANGGGFDLMASSFVKVARTIPDAVSSRRGQYRISFADDDAAEVFPDDQRQTLKAGPGKGSGTLTVVVDSPGTGAPGAATVGQEYLLPNTLINSDDPLVVRHMRKAVGELVDPWQRAQAIGGWVFKNLTNKNFGTGFASAQEVARNLAGDCTEHGVLTAAMCRAAGIPSRCVVGLVYIEGKGFGPHMWNEVYVNRRWVAIDATFDQSAVDATHLKLADTSLAGVAPIEAMQPVMRVFGERVTIEPVEVR